MHGETVKLTEGQKDRHEETDAFLQVCQISP